MSEDYALGHSRDELDRLVSQGWFMGDLTEHVFRRAGLAAGLRVLDLGCGAGDVSFLAARLVGPTGAVIGIDRSADAVATAQERARAAGLTNVEFIAQSVDEVTLPQPVDAVVGRLVLMYLADPAAVLRRVLAHVRPGGIVAFQELDTLSAVAEPPCPVFETAGRRINEALVRAGVDIRAGLRLPATFIAAGLPRPETLQMARVEHGPDAFGYQWIAQLTRTLLPLFERTGVATAAEVDVETLAERMRAEAVERQAVLVMPPLIGAWSRVPGDTGGASTTTPA